MPSCYLGSIATCSHTRWGGFEPRQQPTTSSTLGMLFFHHRPLRTAVRAVTIDSSSRELQGDMLGSAVASVVAWPAADARNTDRQVSMSARKQQQHGRGSASPSSRYRQHSAPQPIVGGPRVCVPRREWQQVDSRGSCPRATLVA